MRRAVLILALVACGKDKHAKREAVIEQASGSGSNHSIAGDRCAQLPFAPSSPVPEASGAAWLPIDGKLSLVVVSDSGNRGEYAVIDPETGETGERGSLALGAAGDDLEGAAARGGLLVALNSSGWIRTWKHDDATHAFTVVDEPYPLGPIDLSDKKDGNHPPAGDGMVCGAKVTNCGRNYEGVCLVDPAHQKGPCVGFAAAKADGHLYCLTDEAGKLVVHHDKAIEITRPGALADCAFGDDGSLWAGSNLFDLANVYQVTGWDEPATATVTLLAAIGVGFPETLAVRGDLFYRMSDTGGSPSLLAKFRCSR